MYFTDTDNTEAGERVFDIKLQGRRVAKRLDIVKEAGGSGIALVKEFAGIKVKDDLTVEFASRFRDPERNQMPIINGIEIVREDA